MTEATPVEIDLLADYPVHVTRAVSWGEMDAFDHVNNAVYFRYFEDGRIVYFERTGLIAHMKATRVGPILARTECVFRRPLRYPDTITIGVRATDLADDRFTMRYAIASETLGEIAAIGSARVVILDYAAGTKAALPQPVRDALLALDPKARDDG